MTILKIAALSSLIILIGLAGCSSTNYDTNKNSNQGASADYKPSNNGYMGSRSIGTVMTDPQGMTVYTRTGPAHRIATGSARSIGRR